MWFGVAHYGEWREWRHRGRRGCRRYRRNGNDGARPGRRRQRHPRRRRRRRRSRAPPYPRKRPRRMLADRHTQRVRIVELPVAETCALAGLPRVCPVRVVMTVTLRRKIAASSHPVPGGYAIRNSARLRYTRKTWCRAAVGIDSGGPGELFADREMPLLSRARRKCAWRCAIRWLREGHIQHPTAISNRRRHRGFRCR